MEMNYSKKENQEKKREKEVTALSCPRVSEPCSTLAMCHEMFELTTTQELVLMRILVHRS